MSSEPNYFRQLCDKPCPNEIQCMQWNPKSDLIALLTTDGEVRLHRLYWGKVWSYAEKGSKYSVMAWNPDGKILAIGNENGFVRLIEVEKCNTVYLSDIGAPISSMDWFDVHERAMSILVVGTENGDIEFFVNGMFKIAAVHGGQCITNVFLSKNLKVLTAVSTGTDKQSGDEETKNFTFYRLDLFSSRSKEIEVLAVKYEAIHNLLQKFDAELKQMSDSWENSLQKVSSKLDKLAEILPADTSVSDEFLMAFACGTLSAELQTFLVNELTIKGLKKLGADLNASYANIKSHVVNNMQTLCFDLSLKLSELLGMARWYEKYGILGLCERKVQESIQYLGSFMLKIAELLSVIDKDLKSCRAFFKWVSGVMYRISDEPIPNVFKEFNQEDYSCILDFLQTQLVKNKDQQSFNLEKVGYYVKGDEKEPRENVHHSNPWYDFVEASTTLRDNPLVVLPEKDTSLSEMAHELNKKIERIFNGIKATVSESFTSEKGSAITKEGNEHKDHCRARFTWADRKLAQNNVLFVLPCTCKMDTIYKICMNSENPLDLNISSLFVDLKNIPHQDREVCGSTIIRDIHFYEEDDVTIMLEDNSEDNSVKILAQLQLASLADVQLHRGSMDNIHDLQSTDVSNFISKWRYLDSFDPLLMSVSGTRKVSCLLSKNRRRVRIYDMDAEDEDEGADSEDESQMDDL